MNERHIAELDGVRGIACLLVVTYHCFFALAPQSFLPLFEYVHHLDVLMVGGVDLFFVLSGFLIGGILLDHRSAANFFGAFWVRRASRILPVYVLLLLTYLLALALRPLFDAPWLDLWLLGDPLPLWTYATFTQNYVMAMRPDHVGSLWVGITWSLAVEEQFYLLFPLLVYALRRTTLLWVAIGCIVAAPVIRVALWELGGTFYSGYFPTPARMDSLMFGFVVACVIRHRASLELVRRFRLPLDVVGLALFVLIVEDSIGRWMPTLRFTSLSAMFAYGILRIFLVEQGWYRSALRSSFLVNVGLISYAWYMYHQAVNGLLHGMILHSTPLVSNGRELAVSCLVLLVSAALAAISTRYYERLFRLLGRRVAFASRSTVMAPAQ